MLACLITKLSSPFEARFPRVELANILVLTIAQGVLLEALGRSIAHAKEDGVNLRISLQLSMMGYSTTVLRERYR